RCLIPIPRRSAKRRGWTSSPPQSWRRSRTRRWRSTRRVCCSTPSRPARPRRIDHRMRLYDTARRAVVPFQPRDNRVGMYVCGITPYDAAHMGHAFAYHVFDVIARRLILLDVDVHHVRNITDVDDDILRVARERNADYRTVGDAQVQRFDRDMADIGLLPVDAAPRATMHVAEMVRWIARLHEEGYAYEQAGWVFFDTAKFPRYGLLSGLDVATMTALSRERGADPDDPRKRNPLDFVLWQQSAAGEPSWPSPWSDGRPG